MKKDNRSNNEVLLEFVNKLKDMDRTGVETPCKNCGRVVLAGRCCDKPTFE